MHFWILKRVLRLQKLIRALVFCYKWRATINDWTSVVYPLLVCWETIQVIRRGTVSFWQLIEVKFRLLLLCLVKQLIIIIFFFRLRISQGLFQKAVLAYECLQLVVNFWEIIIIISFIVILVLLVLIITDASPVKGLFMITLSCSEPAVLTLLITSQELTQWRDLLFSCTFHLLLSYDSHLLSHWW